MKARLPFWQVGLRQPDGWLRTCRRVVVRMAQVWGVVGPACQ